MAPSHPVARSPRGLCRRDVRAMARHDVIALTDSDLCVFTRDCYEARRRASRARQALLRRALRGSLREPCANRPNAGRSRATSRRLPAAMPMLRATARATRGSYDLMLTRGELPPCLADHRNSQPPAHEPRAGCNHSPQRRARYRADRRRAACSTGELRLRPARR